MKRWLIKEGGMEFCKSQTLKEARAIVRRAQRRAWDGWAALSIFDRKKAVYVAKEGNMGEIKITQPKEEK